MLHKTEGIVLRSVKYGETSLILDIYTYNWGLRTYVLNGVRKRKATVPASTVQLLSLVDMVVYHRPEKELNRIKELKPAETLVQLPFDVIRGSIGMFLAELAQQVIKESEQNNDVYAFLKTVILWLDHTEELLKNVPVFLLKQFSVLLGFAPYGSANANTPFFDLKEGSFVTILPDHPYFLPENLSIPFSQSMHLQLSRIGQPDWDKDTRHLLIEKWLDYYCYHIDGFKKLKSYEILRTVLN